MKDFFISYNRADKQWAEWIAWTLEEAGYSVVIQAWDFQAGGNFVLEMQRAAAESRKTLAVLSESYLKSSYTQPEWAAAFAQDPQSVEHKLIPVRVKECNPEGLLKPIIYVDLVGLIEVTAKQTLLDSLRPLLGSFPQRGKPDQPTAFPGLAERVIELPKAFPTALSRVQQIKETSLQKRLDSLRSDYEAVSQQIDCTINGADRKRLERQLLLIAEDMEKVATELDELGK